MQRIQIDSAARLHCRGCLRGRRGFGGRLLSPARTLVFCDLRLGRNNLLHAGKVVWLVRWVLSLFLEKMCSCFLLCASVGSHLPLKRLSTIVRHTSVYELYIDTTSLAWSVSGVLPLCWWSVELKEFSLTAVFYAAARISSPQPETSVWISLRLRGSDRLHTWAAGLTWLLD